MDVKNWSKPMVIEFDLIIGDIKKDLNEKKHVSKAIAYSILEHIDTILWESKEYSGFTDGVPFTGLEEVFLGELLDRASDLSCRNCFDMEDHIAVHTAAGLLKTIGGQLERLAEDLGL